MRPGVVDGGSRLALAGTFVLAICVARPLAAQLTCNGAVEHFDAGIGNGWTVRDEAGAGVTWKSTAACGEDNYTGGSGGAACVSSDRTGVAEFSAELRSPSFSLASAQTASLSFRANYQNFSRTDTLELEISTDGGATWANLLRWKEDHGSFRELEGETAAADLSAYAGRPGLLLRWRYLDPGTGDFAWYAQVDDVQLRCDLEAPCPPGSTAAPLVDGGFEAGTPSPAWVEASTNFGSPICQAASCGFSGARSGSAWAFLGGATSPETGSLAQNVTLTAGIAKLTFHLWAPAASGNSTDDLRVLVDGQEIFRALEQEPAYRQDYIRVERDLSAFADGSPHELRFAAQTSGQPAHTNFFVDDVAVSVCTAVIENPEIRISDVAITEGNAGTFDAVFTVSLSGASRREVSVDFVTAPGTAGEGSDYLPRSGRMVFAPGMRLKTIAVPIIGDVVDELDETFDVRLSGAVNGTIGDGEGLGTIRNDDQTWIAVTDAAALEQDGTVTTATFTVSLSRPSSRPILVDYRTSDGTATAGRDYDPLAGTLSFPPGATRQTLTVQVSDDRVVERDEVFLLTLNNPLNAAIEREEGVGTIIDNDRGRYPVEGTVVIYTIDTDFDQGRLLNLTYETVHDQLQLTRVLGTYPYIWVAASDRGTLVKVDTRTGTVLGEYSTSPDHGAAAVPNPSRTTVGLDGGVWAGNRGDRSVIHVGLIEAGQCIDRNANGTIETSHGYGDVLPWPNAGGEDSDGGISTAQDECILHYTKVSASVVRHLSVDRENNIWVSGLGGDNDRVFNLVDGTTGAILQTVGPLACGGYGGLVDRNGVLWSADYGGPVLRWDPAIQPPTAESLRCLTGIASYGLGIGPSGDVWVAAPSGDRVWRIRGDGREVSGPYRHGSPAAQGIAVAPDGDVWVSSAKWGGSATIGHLKGDGRFVGSVTDVPVGSSGVAIDASGKVWSANVVASSLSRIDPFSGPIGADGATRVGMVDLTVALPGANPYNYSDMTGSLALASTSPQGSWQVIQDAGAAGATWGTISWNSEPQGTVPPGGAIEVEARAAESEAGLGGLPFTAVASGVPFDLVGRFIQVRVTVRPAPLGLSPVLSDLRVQARAATPPSASVSVGNAQVFEGNTATGDAIFTVALSAAVSHPVSVAYTTEEGSALPGADFTARSGILTLPAGTTSAAVAVPVVGDTLAEPAEFFFLRLSNPSGAMPGDGLGIATIVDNDRRVLPVESRNRVYTFDDDFELGRLFNTQHDAPNQHQLQVSRELTTFPYLWIAASFRSTIVKIDTRTGTVLGEYHSKPNPTPQSFGDPSRTTVALDGSVWTGNRADGSVVHIGLVEEGQCVDRNGNGSIETSVGFGNILPWPNTGNADSAGGVSTARDECILHYVRVSAQITRHLSVDKDNNVWVSGRYGANNAVFNYLDGQTGQILRTEGPFPCGGYGGLIDRSGILWSTNQQGPVLRWDPRIQPVTPQSFRCIPKFFDWRYSYGAAADSLGNIWVTGIDGNVLWKIPPDGNEVLGPFGHGSFHAQGLAIDKRDHIWVSSALQCCSSTVGHVLPDGTFLGNVVGVPFGSTGVAVDSLGKIWTANIVTSTASRIDPNAGPIGSDGITRVGAVDLVVPLPGAQPYNYSDMTGFLALQKTLPRGTWHVIQDGGVAGTAWGRITWNAEAQGSEPPGTSILVEVRAADAVAGLGGLAFLPVSNGTGFSAIGRFLEVRVVLRPNPQGVSPVLSDMRIEAGDYALPQIAIGDSEVPEGDTGSVLGSFTVRLSVPAEREIRVDFSTADGDAASTSDYVAASSTAVFPAGNVSQTVSVPVRGDVLDELDEQFFVNLERPVGAVIADGQAVGRIVDDDAPVLLSVNDVSVEEGDSGTNSALFHVTLSATPGHTVTVDYRTADGSAQAGADYRLAEGYLVLPPGTTDIVVVVAVLGDTLPEPNETFTLNLINAVGAELARPQGQGTIVDDDNIELSINDVEVTEGDSGTTEARFTLSAASPARETASVVYETVAGTATEAVDYLAATGTATLQPGETTTSITILVTGDLVLEPDEDFSVALSDPVKAVLNDATGRAIIRDDERCPGPNLLLNPGAEERPVAGELPGWVSVPDASWTRRTGEVAALEGKRYFGAQGGGELAELRQDVSLEAYESRIVAGGQRFAFEGYVRSLPETAVDTARIVVEYRDASNLQVLDSFDSGELGSTETWQRVEDVRPVPALARWARIRLIATRHGGATLDSLFDGLSLRSRRSASLTVSDVTIYEGDEGLRDAVFHVRLSCAVQSDFAVSYATEDGTALAGPDYLATAGTITFPAGSPNETVSVPVVGDTVNEAHETFALVLRDPVGATVTMVDPEGLGIVVNDDACRRSHGYWKTHPEAWPVHYLALGGVEYEKPALLSFLSSSSPDASLILARELVATKLNLSLGSKPTILAIVDRADSLLATHPPASNPQGSAREEALSLKDALDSYNNGKCSL